MELDYHSLMVVSLLLRLVKLKDLNFVVLILLLWNQLVSIVVILKLMLSMIMV